nr:MAG TPA: hypothetical protein [Bacteriophage sp.]
MLNIILLINLILLIFSLILNMITSFYDHYKLSMISELLVMFNIFIEIISVIIIFIIL